ncbi:hypothetical protein [Chryseobacterium indoltheticum]|uniref:hypothetical protein n=1 Tax=Chryseobacterium indoltheticum TaxID=254 RepID=UPI003F493E22
MLKSFVIFIVMSLLNVQFTEWTLSQIGLPGGNYGMLSILILIECGILSTIGFVTVLIFKKHHYSIFRIALLFEILYLLLLIISGVNPFLYLIDNKDENFLNLFMYLNSFIVLLLMFFIHWLYSKITSSKNNNLS